MHTNSGIYCRLIKMQRRTRSVRTPGHVSAFGSYSFIHLELLVIETREQRGTFRAHTHVHTHIYIERERDKRVAWLVISLVCSVLDPRLVGPRVVERPGSYTQPMWVSFHGRAAIIFLSESLALLLCYTKRVWVLPEKQKNWCQASALPCRPPADELWTLNAPPHVPTAGNV